MVAVHTINDEDDQELPLVRSRENTFGDPSQAKRDICYFKIASRAEPLRRKTLAVTSSPARLK